MFVLWPELVIDLGKLFISHLLGERERAGEIYIEMNRMGKWVRNFNLVQSRDELLACQLFLGHKSSHTACKI